MKQFLKVAAIGFGLLAGFHLSAQTDFVPGYVVKAEGDTLFGQIDHRNNEIMHQLCVFRPGKKELPVQFLPGEIHGFRITEGQYFISKEVDGQKKFLEYLVNGKVSVYFLKDGNDGRYFLERDDLSLSEIPYEEEVVSKGESDFIRKSTAHIGYLSVYMDDPSLQKRIRQVSEPDHNTLIKLAKDYHDAVCDYECVVYKKKGSVSLFVEPFGGISKAKYASTYHPEFGVFISMNTALMGKNHLIRSGLTYQEFDQNSFYRIPLQYHLVFPIAFIKPRVGFGYNFYLGRNPANPEVATLHTLGLSPGFNLDFLGSTQLSFTYNFEFTSPLSSQVINDTETSEVFQSFHFGIIIPL